MTDGLGISGLLTRGTIAFLVYIVISGVTFFSTQMQYLVIILLAIWVLKR